MSSLVGVACETRVSRWSGVRNRSAQVHIWQGVVRNTPCNARMTFSCHAHNLKHFLRVIFPIYWCFRSKEGQRFLQLEISRMQEILQKKPECAQLHAALGSHYELTRDLSNAEEHLTKSLELKYGMYVYWFNYIQAPMSHTCSE